MDALEIYTMRKVYSYNSHGQHSNFKIRIFIIHIKYSVTAISDVRCISKIMINTSLMEDLQINKGRGCC